MGRPKFPAALEAALQQFIGFFSNAPIYLFDEKFFYFFPGAWLNMG